MIESRKMAVTGVETPVTVFKISNEQGYYTELCNYGASVLSIIVPDRNGTPGDVVLGYEDLHDFIGDGPYMGKTLGRFAGRIAKGQFKVNDRPYQLDINNGQNHLHGGKHGISFRFWEYELSGENTICFTTTIKSCEDGYPGDIALSVAYNWSDDNALTVTYRGIPTEDSPMNLSNHSYFNLQGSESVLNHELCIHADQYFLLNNESIPLSQTESVRNTPMDFTEFRPIGQQMDCKHPQLAIDRGYNHCWSLHAASLSGSNPAVELTCPQNGRILRVYTDYPGAVVYCGNYFDGQLRDKQHRPLEAYAGIAIEMQYYPDCVNMPEAPSCIVKQGNTSVHRIKYCFGVCS